MAESEQEAALLQRWRALASAFVGRRQSMEAGAALRRVLVLDPGDAACRFQLALEMERGGETGPARALYARGLAANPDSLEARLHLAALSFAAGEGETALVHLLRVRERDHANVRAEAELARLAAIVESSDDAIIGVSLGGVIETWNRGAEEIFGWAASEVRDKPLNVLIPAGHADHLSQNLDQIRRGQRVTHYETIRRRKDGEIISVSISISPVRNMAGEVASASVIMRDITERKQAERERLDLLQQVQHALARSKRLTGHVQICQVCKRVRSNSGHWVDVERYLDDHTDADPILAYCPDHAPQGDHVDD